MTGTKLNDGKIAAKLVKVTPKMATEWLRKNTKNRKFRMRNVRQLASYMKDGSYLFTGDTIRFYEDGTLADGQHRLNAILLSDTSQDCVVVTGIPEAAGVHIDTGAKRTAGDVLCMYEEVGENDAKTVAAAIRMILLHDDGKGYCSQTSGTGMNINNQHIREFYKEHEEELSNSLMWLKQNGVQRRALISPTHQFFIHYIFYRKYGEVVEGVLHSFLRGVFQNDKTPTYLLHDKLLKDRLSSSSSLPDKVKLYSCVKAIEKEINDILVKSSKGVTWYKTEPTPFIKPANK